MRVLKTGCRKLMSGEGIKHEGVIGIRGMRQLDLDRLFLGFRGCLLARHGLVRFLLLAVSPLQYWVVATSTSRQLPRPGFGSSQRDFAGKERSFGDERRKTCASQGLAWRQAGRFLQRKA